MGHVIRLNPDGTVQTLYTETIDLRILGKPTITRASHVEYSNERQGWTVELEPGVLGTPSTGSMLAKDGNGWYASLMKLRVHVFPSRSAALAAEVEYLQAKLVRGEVHV